MQTSMPQVKNTKLEMLYYLSFLSLQIADQIIRKIAGENEQGSDDLFTPSVKTDDILLSGLDVITDNDSTRSYTAEHIVSISFIFNNYQHRIASNTVDK